MSQAIDLREDYSAWVSRSETQTDTASRFAATGLAAVLDHRIGPDLDVGFRLFPLAHWLQFPPTATMSELGADGHPKLGGFMPPLPLPRRMWAGSKIAFHSPILVGQQLSRTTTIESITPKHGSSGRLCFVGLRHDVSADGISALTEHQTIVYREAAEADPAAPSPRRPPRADTPAPEGWDWSRVKRVDEVTLFRYSALTFNSHRIHYDLPYATEIEGYPGLVVHGPLSATLMMDSFLTEHPGSRLTKFEFSTRSPVFVNEHVHIVGRAAADGTEELAVIASGGQAAVTARISFR
ncbi:MaoC family dehydratase N-terminal domain-containing protein [Arthrobacter bambusae]|uniref:FAS1-like dehydratase domain-containing protein n=1 Tax=Arthrobacter bambusae TaxID=1338426 RepID=UPI001F50F360|nr:MaoC family dehydratase N-terminal domain-containing protein [Arthrobacter bambusae]MCI0142620.1 MaoC family dehydratase N-terminal domain-containing protein [Arthrobacter bambusae]